MGREEGREGTSSALCIGTCTHAHTHTYTPICQISCLNELSFLQGKYYMLFEHASNLYRTFLPTPLWFRYLSNSHSSGAIFATVITALYVMIKGIVLFGKVKETYRAAVSFLQDPVRWSPLPPHPPHSSSLPPYSPPLPLPHHLPTSDGITGFFLLQFFGTTPSREDLHQMGQSCSICQEDICHPVMLRCRVSPI